MPRLNIVIIGPSRGGFTMPRTLTTDVQTVQTALAAAAEHAAADGAAAHGASGPSVVAFLNGSDVRLGEPETGAASHGDALTVIYPATDT